MKQAIEKLWFFFFETKSSWSINEVKGGCGERLAENKPLLAGLKKQKSGKKNWKKYLGIEFFFIE